MILFLMTDFQNTYCYLSILFPLPLRFTCLFHFLGIGLFPSHLSVCPTYAVLVPLIVSHIYWSLCLPLLGPTSTLAR